MADYKDYNITDTANDLLNQSSLDAEFRASGLSDVFDGINRDQGSSTFRVQFVGERTAQELLDADAVVAAHQGQAPTKLAQEVTVSGEPPFKNKTVGDKKLFSRATGQAYPVTVAGNPNVLEFSVPYAQVKFNGAEIINTEIGETVNLKVMDDSNGTYTTVPNYQLNQFGFDVAMAPGCYVRESNYDADLYGGMVIRCEYTAINDKTIYINYLLHELKD